MKLPDDVRQRLANEFRFAVQHMADAEDFATQLYFLTVFSSATNRAFNQSWSDELALVHLVAQAIYVDLNTLTPAVMRGQYPTGFPPELPEELTKACDGLAQVFESDQIDSGALYSVLARLAEIGYASTGNGRYQSLRGHIKLSSDS